MQQVSLFSPSGYLPVTLHDHVCSLVECIVQSTSVVPYSWIILQLACSKGEQDQVSFLPFEHILPLLIRVAN